MCNFCIQCFGVDCEEEVPGQGPGCSGPREDECIFICQLERDRGGDVINIFVALRDFEVRERRHAPWADVHGFVALLEEVFFC